VQGGLRQDDVRGYNQVHVCRGSQGNPSIMSGGGAGWAEDTFRGRCVKGPGGASKCVVCSGRDLLLCWVKHTLQ
jgi:hypothetical protein